MAESSQARPTRRGFLQSIGDLIGKTDFFRSLSYTQARQGDGDISAGHVGKYISLANPDRLSSMMCHVPLVISGGMVLSFALTALFSLKWYLVLFGLLSTFMLYYIGFTCVLSLLALFRCRKATDVDYDDRWAKWLRDNPGEEENMMHVCILPNYKEDEEMLAETIGNLSKSILAEKHMVIVLGMEAREGEEGRRKSERLITRFRRHFKDIFATYHPANIPGEVAGKSSNTQWAFREVQKWYGSYVSRNPHLEHDMSKIFLTIADADAIVHRNYFVALSLQGLEMSTQERTWTIFQSPVMLFRNWETSPCFLRIAAYGTMMWELSGLMMTRVVDAFCFSCYSMTFALANHPIVDGWDADVIAEDHHMYLKCMFASYWEELFSSHRVQGVSKLQLEPVWLPVTSYLPESGSVLASAKTRFDQARRHMQGVAELSYAILQYISINSEAHRPSPIRYHFQVWGVLYKLFHIHVMTSFHGIQNLIVAIGVVVWSVVNFFNGDVVGKAVELAATADPLVQSIMLYGVAMPSVFVSTVFALISFISVCDSIQGRYCPRSLQATEVEIADAKGNKLDTISLSSKERWWLAAVVYFETWVHGQTHVVMFAAIPHYLAILSLSMYGHKFDYKCAVKPPMKPKQIGAAAAAAHKNGGDREESAV